MNKHLIKTYQQSLENLTKLSESKEMNHAIVTISKYLIDCFQNGGKVLIAGNGGSHCSALHFAEELTGRFRKDRRPLGAIALGEATHTTCIANDYTFSSVFSRQVQALATKNDILILLSTSGASSNLIYAAAWAKEAKIKTIALLGKTGGSLKDMTNVSIVFPGETSDRIQELHMLTLHNLVELIERNLFPENYEL